MKNERDLKNIYNLIVCSRQENDLKLKIEHLPAFLSIQNQQIIVFMFTSTAYLNRRISSGISYVAPSPKAIDKQQGKGIERKSS